jgi:hypothetical protein
MKLFHPVSLLLSQAIVLASAQAPTATFTVNGHVYAYYAPGLIPGGQSAAASVASTTSQCGIKGHLADLTTAEENAAVAAAVLPFSGMSFMWIGLNDLALEGDYRWSDNEPVGMYTNWGMGQPNGLGENCVVMLDTGRWADLPCFSGGLGALIEYDCPPPASRTFVYNMHIYEYYARNIIPGNKTVAAQFASSKVMCGVHGHLADLTTQPEASAIANFFRTSVPFNEYAWIGLSDEEIEGLFKWSDGSVATYFDWGTNGENIEPDGGNAEDCVFLGRLMPSGMTTVRSQDFDVLLFPEFRLSLINLAIF